jgi:hypothetical protein
VLKVETDLEFDGYIDLTPEELLAALGKQGFGPPPHLSQGYKDVDPIQLDLILHAGTRSLMARGLIEGGEGERSLVPVLAALSQTIGQPGMVANVVIMSESVGSTWLFANPEFVAAMTDVGDGIQRLRLFPVDQFPDVVSLTCELDELSDTPSMEDPFEVLLPDLPVDFMTNPVPFDEAVSETAESQKLAEISGPGSSFWVLTVSTPLLDEGLEGIDSRSVMWLRNSEGVASLLTEKGEGVLVVQPSSGVEVSERISNIFIREVADVSPAPSP